MNVANLDLCKMLYEVSGWDYSDNGYELGESRKHEMTPRYDLGYLLRKLPKSVKQNGTKFNLTLEFDENGLVTTEYRCYKWNNQDVYVYDTIYHNTADTPEDAVAKLAIELFKQGILKKEAA